MDKKDFREVLADHLAGLGYLLELPETGFDLSARGARERLLVDVRGGQPSDSKLWSAFVGAVSRATLALEKDGLRGTVCIAFSADYAEHLGQCLGQIDPRIVVLYLDAQGDLRRLRGAWDVAPGDELAFAPTIVVRTPQSPRHPDGRFVVGEIAYEVRRGGVAWATDGGALVFPPPTFLDLCRRAGLTAATETAPTILQRVARPASERIAGAA